MEKLNYRLDRGAFQAMNFEEADKQLKHSTDLTEEERVNQFNYLMSVAYSFLGKLWSEMDRTFFEKRKRN